METNYNLKWIADNIDSDYVANNPDVVVDLVQGLIKEYYNMKDYIQSQREELLLLKAMTVNQ